MSNEKQVTMKSAFQKMRIYQYYILIGVLSLICLFVMPFMGSAVGLQFSVPNTVAGWTVFTICNLASAVLSLMIFHCFVQQAKVNIRDDPKFKEAQAILAGAKLEDYNPRDPHSFLKHQYTTKGVMVFIGSLTAMVGLSNAILRFDLVILLSFVTVVIGAVVSGLIEMNVVEEYWTDEYWFYAKKIEKEMLERERNEERTDASELASLSITSSSHNITSDVKNVSNTLTALSSLLKEKESESEKESKK